MKQPAHESPPPLTIDSTTDLISHLHSIKKERSERSPKLEVRSAEKMLCQGNVCQGNAGKGRGMWGRGIKKEQHSSDSHSADLGVRKSQPGMARTKGLSAPSDLDRKIFRQKNEAILDSIKKERSE